MSKDQLTKDRLLWMYERMLKIRRFEEEAHLLFLQGELPGTLHLYSGQEAVAVGACAALRPDDYITSTHRPHGHALAKGVSPNALMAELFARTTGCCRAKGGSMHVGDIGVGMVPAIAIVGAGIPIAAGIGLAFKRLGTDRAVACFFGDGASNEGAFHEGLNMAAIWDLPVIFVCENNLYGASTHVSQVMRVEHVADRAAAYGMPGVVVDGMDVLAVYDAVQEAVARARAGQGPTLLECKTYRYMGHSRSDPGHYRSPEEVEAWRARDPIPRLKAWLLEKSIATAEEVEELERAVERELEEAVAFARASPRPRPEEALEGVYFEEG
ncbi:MAG: thiamine pyrophosphate-dependent dehydrogenase E1 component subunit alpha, partial [Anaerolineae bacterium]